MRTTPSLLLLAASAATGLAGCELLETATSDRPSQTQMEGIGDMFGSFGAFVTVMADPAGASEGDLADLHAIAPYEQIVDPERAVPTARVAPGPRVPLDPGCVVVEGDLARWDCDFTLEGAACHATGSGTDNGDGSYSGSSLATCAGFSVAVTATRLRFDEAAGAGSGRVDVEYGAPLLEGWARVDITELGFCVDEPSPAPDTGTLTIDGRGPLDGRPFDPLTIRFTDAPVCGTALIE